MRNVEAWVGEAGHELFPCCSDSANESHMQVAFEAGAVHIAALSLSRKPTANHWKVDLRIVEDSEYRVRRINIKAERSGARGIGNEDICFMHCVTFSTKRDFSNN